MRFGAAIFLSAFLLFLVQSVAGKQLLPWFGGAPSTWAACMLFFQLLLLAGYLWAWGVDRWLGPRGQRAAHLGLLAAGAGVLIGWEIFWDSPLLAPDGWKPRSGTEAPVWLILKVLAAGVGIPFLALAANSPLLQKWFADRWPDRPVYRLYAVSNAGSLLGLLSFPFWFEPWQPLPWLARMWAVLFGVMAALCALCAWRGRRAAKSDGGEAAAVPVAPAPEAAMADPARASSCDAEAVGAAASRGWWGWALWIGLSAAASALFLATTNQLSQEVALVPLLWVLPLAIYLLAFMIVFHDSRWYRRGWMVSGAVVMTVVALWGAFLGMRLAIPHQIAVSTAGLLMMCLVLLGELARLKPETRRLTSFYLAIAIGGALGGAAISIGAPMVLESSSEFHVTLLAGWVLVAIVFWRERDSPFHVGGLWYFGTFAAISGAALLRALQISAMADSAPAWMRSVVALACGAAAIGVMAAVGIRCLMPRVGRHPGWAVALVAGIVFVGELFLIDRIREEGAGVVVRDRNFFGSVMVRRSTAGPNHVPVVQMIHGRINHGFQYSDPVLKDQPAGYCSPTSGVGQAILNHPRRTGGTGSAAPPSEGLRIGVAGLGVGAMAAYLRPGETMRFYEINPLVVDYAGTNEGAHFSYLRDTSGEVDVVLGDARLSLERELQETGSQRYDILILDAFSSDSVPVHLLTLEAFRDIYLPHLRDGQSVVAVNISNRFLDFRPLLYSLADTLNLHAQVFFDIGNPPAPTATVWALLTRRPYVPEYFHAAKDWPKPAPDREILWTDSHSDVFSLMRLDQEPVKYYILNPGPPPDGENSEPAGQESSRNLK